MPICSKVGGHSMECGWPKSHTLKENWHTFLQKPSTVHSSPVRPGNLWISSHSRLQHCLAWSCAALVQATTYEFMNAAVLSCPEETVSLWSSLTSDSNDLSASSTMMVPEPCGGVWYRFVTDHSTDNYSLPFDQLWVSALTIYPLHKEPSLMMSEGCTDLYL